MNKKKILIFIIFLILIGIIINNIFISNTTTSNSKLYEYNNFSSVIKYNVNINFNYKDEMTYLNGIHYKEIYNYNEYQKYKNIWNDILELSEEDFKKQFMIIIMPDNSVMTNTYLGELYTDNDTLYIGLQKSKKSEKLESAISIAIDSNLKRDNIEIFKTISNKDYNSNYADLKQLPSNYSIEEAIADNCLVITDTVHNKELFDDFIYKSKNNQDANIRVYNLSRENDIIIYDVAYLSSKQIYIIYEDETRISNLNRTYNYYEYNELNIKDITDNITGISNSYVFSNSELNEYTFYINL